MTKTQKMWMWIFLAIFLIPEVLWSPITNVIFSLLESNKNNPKIFRENFLTLYSNENILKGILTMQFIAISLFLFSLLKNKKNFHPKQFILLLIIALVFFILALLSFYLLIVFNPGL